MSIEKKQDSRDKNKTIEKREERKEQRKKVDGIWLSNKTHINIRAFVANPS